LLPSVRTLTLALTLALTCEDQYSQAHTNDTTGQDVDDDSWEGGGGGRGEGGGGGSLIGERRARGVD